MTVPLVSSRTMYVPDWVADPLGVVQHHAEVPVQYRRREY